METFQAYGPRSAFFAQKLIQRLILRQNYSNIRWWRGELSLDGKQQRNNWQQHLRKCFETSSIEEFSQCTTNKNSSFRACYCCLYCVTSMKLLLGGSIVSKVLKNNGLVIAVLYELAKKTTMTLFFFFTNSRTREPSN